MIGVPYENIRDANYFLENAARVEVAGLKLTTISAKAIFSGLGFTFELFEKFGGVPIITQVVDKDEEIDLLYVPA